MKKFSIQELQKILGDLIFHLHITTNPAVNFYLITIFAPDGEKINELTLLKKDANNLDMLGRKKKIVYELIKKYFKESK